MFKPGEMILYHLPEGGGYGTEARPFLVLQAWPNEYGPGRHGYNGILFLDGSNDARRPLNPEGRTAIAKYGDLPFAHGYSVPGGEEQGMVSATPTHEEETRSLPPMVNISGWGAAIPGIPRDATADGRHVIKLLLDGQTLAKYVTTSDSGVISVTVDGVEKARGTL